MTNNFVRVLGEGGFGVVYHGSLNDTEHVAVKLLSQSSTQGYKQFRAEMITSHPVIRQTREKPQIAEWVGWMLTKGDVENIVDQKHNTDYDSGSVWRALELAMSCVNPSLCERPYMLQVVSELKECLVPSKGGKLDMDSKNPLELSTNFTAEETPDAR